MKVRMIVALLAATFSLQAFAQGETKTNYTYNPNSSSARINPTVGLTFSQLVNDSTSTDMATGYLAGVTTDLGAGSTVFHTGALLTQLNTKAVSGLLEITQNILAIPVQGKTYFSGEQAGAFIRYGLTGNILLSSKASALGQSASVKDINSFNPMGVIGFGALINGSGSDIGFDLSFNRSITKINKGSGNAYNQAIMMSASLSL